MVVVEVAVESDDGGIESGVGCDSDNGVGEGIVVMRSIFMVWG